MEAAAAEWMMPAQFKTAKQSQTEQVEDRDSGSRSAAFLAYPLALQNDWSAARSLARPCNYTLKLISRPRLSD